MQGGGKFQLKAGEWTDDTSMTICLAESLITLREFDARDQMRRYLIWADTGQPGPKPHSIGMGKTIFKALSRFAKDGSISSGIEAASQKGAGNGTLMRLAPVVLAFFPDRPRIMDYTRQTTFTTHPYAICLEESQRLAEILYDILVGKTKSDLMIDHPEWREIRNKPSDRIRGTGFAPESLEAALWSFLTTENFRDAILAATNLGDDADTTASICGQIAGAYYGYKNIPKEWCEKLFMGEKIQQLGEDLYDLSQDLIMRRLRPAHGRKDEIAREI